MPVSWNTRTKTFVSVSMIVLSACCVWSAVRAEDPRVPLTGCQEAVLAGEHRDVMQRVNAAQWCVRYGF